MKLAWSLVFKELLHHRGNFLLSLTAVMAAVTICVALAITEDASKRETRKVALGMGFNLRVIPKDTDMEKFYLAGFSDETMSDQAIETLAQTKGLSYNHLVATLQQKFPLDGHHVILTGISGEMAPPGRKKPPMSFAIEPGTLHVGHEVARKLGLKKGDTLQLADKSFKVARRAPEMGTADDLRISGDLGDVQQVLNMPGRINEIKAIDCLCQTPDQDPLGQLRAELQGALPDARLIMLSDRAEVRARQRQMTEKYAVFISAALLIVAAAWVGVMAILNVRERINEIGLLRALGYGSGTIAVLVLGRAILIGIVAALLGYTIGSWLAVTVGPEIFQLTAKAIRFQPVLLLWSLLLAPLFAVVASFVPAAIAIQHDPAVTLRQE